MPYAILRFAKKKAGGLSACYYHNERKKETYKSNPDIVTARGKENYHLIVPRQSYPREVKRLIAAAGCKTRKDSTVMVETMITASPEFMERLSPAEKRDYFALALSFLETKVGRKNIISAIVHMDERTPHMHLSFCPIVENTKGGKSLSAKTLLGNQATLSKWQTDFHATMSERWTELERGISSQITKRKHIPLWLFKTAERLDKQLAEVEAALEGINPLNAKKQREQAMSVLEKWFPQAERFTSQIKTIDDHIKALERAKAEAERQAREVARTVDTQIVEAVAEAKEVMQRRVDGVEGLLHMEMEKAQELRKKIRFQESIINRIPLEKLDQIKAQINKTQKQRTNDERER